MDVVRYARPLSSYNRQYDPTESALKALPYGTWPVPGEFYRDYITAWLGPILEFTFAQQRCVNAWIIAQYGLKRQEFEGVPELDWLRTLLSRGCPLDAFAYLVEHEDFEKLLQFVQRRLANDDEFKFGTFQFDATAAWVDKLLRKWDVSQLPNDAQRSPTHFILFGLMIMHLRRGDTPSQNLIDWSKDAHTIGRMQGVR
jgi:hypothetical protein